MGKVMKIGIALLLGAMFILMLAGCESPTVLKLNSEALLKSVKVAGVDATLGTPDTDWEQTILPNKIGHVYLPRTSLNAAAVTVQASTGAIVYYAQAKESVEPYFISDKTFDFDADDYLFIEVFSENHDAFNVYAIQVHCRNPGLNDIIFDGRSLFGGVEASGRPITKYGDPGKPGTAWDNVEQDGEALFPEGQTGNVRMSLRPEVPYLKVWVAVASGTTEPDFSTGGFNGTAVGWDLTNGGAVNGDPIIDGAYKPAAGGDSESGGISVTLAANNFVYIKVEGSDDSELSFYKLKMVSKSNNRDITNPRFEIYDGNTLVGTYPVSSGRMGTASWSGSEAYGAYSNGAEVEGKTGDTDNGQHLNNVENPSVLSLYLDSEMSTTGATGLRGQPGSDKTKDDHFGQRPPANLRVVFKADFDGDIKFCQPRKNQRDAAEFNITSGDFGKLIGFWWWGVEVTSAMGEKGWYKFATRIGSQKADILDNLTINGVSVNFSGIKPAYTSTHYDPDNDFKYATVTLPASTNFGGIQVVVKPQAGYYPLISAAMAPDVYTNVPNVQFNINQDSGFNSATGEFSGGFALEPGNFIFVRVTAEISYFYGGSGFTSATWAPNRNLTDPVNRYGVQRFYKVQVLKEGAQNEANLTDISNKGTALNANVNNGKVTQTDNAATITSTDRKGNAEAVCAVKTVWDSQIGNDVQVANFVNSNFQAVLATDSNKARVAFALRSTATEEATTTDSKGNVTDRWLTKVPSDQFLPPAKFNDEIAVDTNTWFVARIISESGIKTNYYRFHLINSFGNSTVPTAIRAGSVNVTPIPTSNATVTGTNVTTVKLPNKAAFDSVTITVTKPNANTSVSIGLTDVNNAAPSMYTDATGTGTTASVTFTYVPIAQFVVIRVISADKTATAFYKIRLELNNASTATTITDIKIANTSITSQSGVSLPTANTAATGTNAITYFIPGDVTVLNNLQVNATAAAGATVGYTSTATASAAPTNYNDTGLFPIFTDNNYLVIRVMAEDNITAAYYKVLIINGTFVTISFDTDGGTPSTISSIRVKSGGTMGSQFPSEPTKATFDFDGWYLASDTTFSGTNYLATTVISANTALKARWVTALDHTQANIRAVSGTGNDALYGLYIGGMPAVSNGTPGKGHDISTIVNGKIVSNSVTNTATTPVVVIVENTVTKVEFGSSAADDTVPTNWVDLTKNETNNTTAQTNKRYTGTLGATPVARAWVRITGTNTAVNVYRYEWYTASSARATLTSLSIDGVEVDSTNYGSFAGWWNVTTAPNFTEAGEVTISAAGSVEVISAFNNTGSTGITSYYVIPAETTVPLLEDVTIPAASFTSTSGTGGTGNVTVDDGDYILIRYASDQTSGNYWGLMGYYLIKVTVDE